MAYFSTSRGFFGRLDDAEGSSDALWRRRKRQQGSRGRRVSAHQLLSSGRKAPARLKRSTGMVVRIKPNPSALTSDLRELIFSSRQMVARGVNAALVLLYWQIGRRIRTDILREKRAEYGEEILPTLSAKLVPEFGQGFSRRNLTRMISLAEAFPEQRIIAMLSKELGWSHFVELLPLKKHLQRDFYAEMCRVERWSVRMLRQRISGMLYERTALRRSPPSSPRGNCDNFAKRTIDAGSRVPRSVPVDFLGLQDAYSEKDLEAAILKELNVFWWSWEATCFSRGRSAWWWMVRISTSTSSSTIDGYGGSWPLI